MINFIFLILMLWGLQPDAQEGTVRSGVYSWGELEVEEKDGRERRQILEGSTRDLEYFEAHATTIPGGGIPHAGHTHDDMEELIIIKEGSLKVTLGEESKILGPGSVIMALPGDMHSIYNPDTIPATYYIIRFKSRKPPDIMLGETEGSSFMVDFTHLEFKPHDKGGLWNYYRRGTSMFEYAEMHVTKLNPEIKSHEPHTHGAAEIVLMISGQAEMEINNKVYSATSGDLFYLESEVPHAIRNTGDEPCMYFAFQWE
jgi:(S)-ureidoglycine aminohydrolase